MVVTFFFKFSICHPEVFLTYIEYMNVSVYNTTIYFIYIKYYIDRATCFDLTGSSSGPQRKQIQYYMYVLRKRIVNNNKTYSLRHRIHRSP